MDEERIALFLDYENLALGAREQLGQRSFDFTAVADALAERGRVVVRRAYADWNSFDEDRRMLTRHHVELIEIPQRMGATRKNAADIKMSVDAMELAFERDYVTTFVIGTGDSDFTPLVHKLRELNRRVIGVGVRAATSDLLPPACDEFLFYESLEGVDLPASSRRGRRRRGGRETSRPAEETVEETPVPDDGNETDVEEMAGLVAQTLSGLQRSSDGAVLSSSLKRALLRKDPTFSEADYGFRGFGELLRHLEGEGVVELGEGSAKGDPEVGFPSKRQGEEAAFALLHDTVSDLERDAGTPPQLAGLKDQLRRRQAGFSEKPLGYRSFLQFVKAAETRGLVSLEWDDDLGGYVVAAAG